MSDFIIKYKKNIVVVLISAVCLIATFYAGYMLGIRNAGADVSNNGNGISTVGNELEQAGSAVENAASGIDQAKDTAEKVSGGITAAQKSAQYIQHAADDSAAIIAECKSILANVRARSKTGTPTP